MTKPIYISPKSVTLRCSQALFVLIIFASVFRWLMDSKILCDIFAIAWEQRKLEDEAIEMLVGGDIDKSRVVENGKYPIYANALTNDGIVGYYNDYYRVKAPAVTVTGRGDIGHAQARTADFTPVVRLLAIRSEHDVYFLENAINKHGVIVESTGVPQLTVPQLGNYMIQFPRTIEEETKIGDYFHTLDRLITLHQRQPPIHIRFDHLSIIFNNNYTTSSTCNTIFMKGVLTYANHHYQK